MLIAGMKEIPVLAAEKDEQPEKKMMPVARVKEISVLATEKMSIADVKEISVLAAETRQAPAGSE